MKIRNLIVHPVLFAVYPVLFYYSHNIDQVPFESAVRPLATSLAAALLGWWLLQIFTRDWRRAGAITSLVILLFFFYGHARSFLNAPVSTYLLPTLWILILLLGAFAIVRSKSRFANGTLILNAASTVMLAVVLMNIGIFQVRSEARMLDWRELGALKYFATDSSPEDYPDIYYIVLDAYAREDVLRELYGHDNSGFLGFLENKGFYVANEAFANYGQTALSLGSSLNLAYLDKLVDRIGVQNQKRSQLNMLIHDSQAVSFLKDRGYRIIAFATDRLEMKIANADVLLDSGITRNEFQEGLRNTTPLPELEGSRAAKDAFARYRQHVNFKFDTLGQIAAVYPNPKFVFAYFELPHPPFIVGANGEPIQLEPNLNYDDGDWLIRPGRLTVRQYRDYYRDQLIYTNRRIVEAITGILDRSEKPPILVIFGDHGPRSGLTWDNVDESDVREGLAILNAYYLPGNGSALLYPGISPVNTFRVIFNHYFGTKLDMLPDEYYFSTAKYLYDFHNVTDRIRQ